jgi:hypothetical protein
MSEPAATESMPRPAVTLPRWDRQAWLCVIIATAVLVPRSWLVMRSENECLDADDHLRRGLAVLLGTRGQFAMYFNDPPLGQMILALPMIATGSIPAHAIDIAHWPPGMSMPGERAPGDPPASPERARFERSIRKGVLYGHAWSPDALNQLIAVWKALLFVPVMALVFQWCRAIYGAGAAWLTQAMMLADPTIAAHVPIAALDSLALEGILFACFAIWRYFEAPTAPKLVLAAFASAAAMLMKHTAVIMPGVFILFAANCWIWRPRREGMPWATLRSTLRPRLNVLTAAFLVGCLSIWALLLFDVSVPAEQFQRLKVFRPTNAVEDVIDNALLRRWPAGSYIGCFLSGALTNQMGQRALLFGKFSDTGWWYYFPALMLLKVPIGIWIVFILAVALSLRRRRIFAGEVSIVIPLLAWVVFFMFARINYGFRHYMPPYVFMMMWAGRCLAGGGRAVAVVGWIGAAIAMIHSIAFHPDYMSYVNYPRSRVWMEMTDSNLDWEQSIRQVGPWLDAHPEIAKRAIYVVPRTGRAGYEGRYYLDDRVRFLEYNKPAPRDGMVIISPVCVCGVYTEQGRNVYEFLQSRRPIDMIGHCLLVYDFDQILTHDRHDADN